MAKFVNWSKEATELIEKAAARHGGWERFARLRSVSFQIRTIGGPLLALKGLGRTFSMPTQLEVSPHQRRTIFIDYPRPQRGIFSSGDVRLEDGEQLIAESKAHRKTFEGLSKHRRWKPLDSLYFFGYSLANYFALPFLLAEQALISTRRCQHQGRTLQGVEVRFPKAADTHSEKQRFFFDDDGLLLRHDYTGDVISVLAQGAHFPSEYVEAGGLWFPCKRRVLAAPGWIVTPIPVLTATLEGYQVVLD